MGSGANFRLSRNKHKKNLDGVENSRFAQSLSISLEEEEERSLHPSFGAKYCPQILEETTTANCVIEVECVQESQQIKDVSIEMPEIVSHCEEEQEQDGKSCSIVQSQV